MNSHDTLSNIIATLTDTLASAEKFDKGNSAAGTRVRKASQEAKAALQDLRVGVQTIKNERKA